MSSKITYIYSHLPAPTWAALKRYELSVFIPNPLRRGNSLPLFPAAALTIGRCLVEISRKEHLDESDDLHLHYVCDDCSRISCIKRSIAHRLYQLAKELRDRFSMPGGRHQMIRTWYYINGYMVVNVYLLWCPGRGTLRTRKADLAFTNGRGLPMVANSTAPE